MPVFDMMETFLVKKLKFRPSFTLRFIIRNLYVGKCALPSLSLSLSQMNSDCMFQLVVLLIV